MTLRVDRLASEEIEVEVLPDVGARLHRVRAFGHELLRTPDDPSVHIDDPFYWGGYHMQPWTNRIAPGPTRVGRRTMNLRPNFKDGTAIHGLHYVTPWNVDGPGQYSAGGGGDEDVGWPWPYDVRVTIGVDGSTLRIRHEVTNRADDPMPAGAGIHPWFPEPVEVRVRARRQIASNNDAHAPHEQVTPELDMSDFRALPEEADAAWSDVMQPAFELRWPAYAISAGLRTSPADVYVVAANPGTVNAVAVEPQTHAPWGMRRLLDGEPGGLTWLEPGATLTLESWLEFRRAEEAYP